MINKNGHAIVVGQPYQTWYDNRSDIFTVNAVFGKYADVENKKTRLVKWVKVNDLIPCARVRIKSYLNKVNN